MTSARVHITSVILGVLPLLERRQRGNLSSTASGAGSEGVGAVQFPCHSLPEAHSWVQSWGPDPTEVMSL